MHPSNSTFQQAFDKAPCESDHRRWLIRAWIKEYRHNNPLRKIMEVTCPIEGCDTTVVIEKEYPQRVIMKVQRNLGSLTDKTDPKWVAQLQRFE